MVHTKRRCGSYSFWYEDSKQRFGIPGFCRSYPNFRGWEPEPGNLDFSQEEIWLRGWGLLSVVATGRKVEYLRNSCQMLRVLQHLFLSVFSIILQKNIFSPAM
jgi:hypothetical protein